VVSPQLALLGGVHVGAQRTPEVVAEVFYIGQRADYPDTGGRMPIVFADIIYIYLTILGAPHIGVAQPKHLLRSVLLEPRQSWFYTVFFDPLSVRVIR